MTVVAWLIMILVIILAALIGFLLAWLCIHDYTEHDGWRYEPTHRAE